MQTLTPSGKRYVLTFVDDFSRYTTIYLLANKSETFAKFKEYYELTKNMFNKSIKMIRTDRGGEYESNEFKQFLQNNGIKYQRTAAYSPQQNGVSERKNRTLVEITRCLLFDSEMTNTFWGEAIHTANFLQNVMVWKHANKTPFELWTGRKPIYSNLRRFGAKCYVKIHDELRRKLDKKAVDATLLGFDRVSKAYRCYVPSTRKVVISRDVKFIENSYMKVLAEKPVKQTNQCCEIPIDVLREESDDDSVVCFEMDNLSDDENSEVIGSNNHNLMIDSNDDETVSNTSVMTEAQIIPKSSKKPSRKRPWYLRGLQPPNAINLVMNNEPVSFNDAISCAEKDKWMRAMVDEMLSLETANTWDLVELPKDRKPIGCKWVYKLKSDSTGAVKYKARLVAQGFSQKFCSGFRTSSAPNNIADFAVHRRTKENECLALRRDNSLFEWNIGGNHLYAATPGLRSGGS